MRNETGLSNAQESSSPLILAGPMLRHTHVGGIALWLVTDSPLEPVTLLAELESGKEIPNQQDHQQIQVGERCYIQMLEVSADLPVNTALIYDLQNSNGRSLLAGIKGLCYPQQQAPVFMVQPDIKRLLHGSCRKPHYPNDDALIQADKQLQHSLLDSGNRPSLMMMHGDQIYSDDVAGPMLVAIHQLVEALGLFDEDWKGTEATNLKELIEHPNCYYGREHLLPEVDEKVEKMVFRAGRKPIFTADGAHNHLVSFAEVMAMYLLVWSDTPWQWVDMHAGRERIPEQYRERYDAELPVIEHFRDGLGKVRRLLAQIPTYMMFDDHDVTDDWNLTRGWEEAAYNNDFSRRIIGNCLIGYWLCQGWGNQPKSYQPLAEKLETWFGPNGIQHHDELVDTLLEWDQWHYYLETTPKVVVMDTRTHRWRSESSANKPSGLMDWESLTELQQELINQPAVILVSPAPIFGVKLIEVVQRIFTWIGKPLMVDAENWMAHPGSANVMLNIFRHKKTPPQFIILSGDVHYSFAYDITLRFRKHSPRILQITCSGLKNEFPHKLLAWFDRINLMIFGSKSPLNFLTRRRDMKIERRHPDGRNSRVLLNHSGVGDLVLAHKIEDVQVIVHQADGKLVRFEVE